MIRKEISGYCPTLKMKTSISIDYNQKRNGKGYTKGLGTCDFASFGGNCDYNNCPLLASAPDELP